MPKPKTITEYINSFPKEVQPKLRQLRAAVLAAAPGAREDIKWSMPAFSYKRILVCFAAYKNHIGFYPGTTSVEAFEKDLEKFNHSKGSIQFPLDKPMPVALVKKIIKFRVKEDKENKPWKL